MVVIVVMSRMRMRCGNFVRNLHVATLEPVGYRAVIMEAVTKIGVLCPFRRNRV